MSDPTWDTSKENFQPLKRGRDAKMLDQVTGMANGERATKIKEERSAFWNAIATYDGDDPLEVWVRFIKWTEQMFTSGGRETEVLPLLERCTRELQEVPRYRDDVRYLRIWVKYADCCKEPHDIFKFLQANDVGQRHTLFYEAYAAFLEIRGAFKQAGEVYDRGILMRAEPTQRLKEKLAQFQHRMMKRKQRKMEEGGALEEEGEGETRRFGEVGAAARGGSANAENPGGAVRSGGGGAAGVVGSRARGLGGTGGVGGGRTPKRSNENDGGLEIYCDEEDGVAPSAAPAPWKNLGKYTETRKENTRGATQWTGQGLGNKRSRPGQASAVTPAPDLDIYEDEDLAQAEAEAAANAALMSKSTSKPPPTNALRRRLDAANPNLASNPMLHHGKGAPEPEPIAGERPKTFYGGYNPADTVNNFGEEVCYEERRAARWEVANGPVAAQKPAPGLIIGRETKEEDMELDATVAVPTTIGGVPAEVTATTVQVMQNPKLDVAEVQTAAPPEPVPQHSFGSCGAPPSDVGSGVQGRALERPTDEAQGVPPAGAAQPVAAAVPAGLRWTATEGGTYGMNEPTMTLTTKEAWGDIMSMFSGGLEAERATNPAEMGDAAATAALAPIKEANTPAQKADETESFAIYEDTCLLSKEAVAAAAAPKQQSPIADLEIREDTVVLPPIAATPRPAAFGANAAKTPAMHGRTPLAAMPMRTPLAPTTATRQPLATKTGAAAMPPSAPVAGKAAADENEFAVYEDPTEQIPSGAHSQAVSMQPPAAPANTPMPSDDGGFDVYQDTMHIDPAVMAEAMRQGEGSQASGSAGSAQHTRTFGEPSENAERRMEFAFNAENIVPAFDIPPGSFIPRSIAEAAAAAAVFKPVSINLSPSVSESEVALSERTLRSAQPTPGLEGNDEFEVLADEAASALQTLKTTTRPSPIASVRTSNLRHSASPINRIAQSADPFDRDAFDAHLATVDRGLATFPGVYVHAGDTILASLRAAAKAGGGARVRARGGTSLVLGSTEYVLMGLAGSGANAKVYEAEYAEVASVSDEDDEGFGGLAIKVQSARLARWEWMVCKRLAGRIDPLHAAGVVQPSALHLVGGTDVVKGSDAEIGVLIMPFGDHGTLQDVLNSYLRVGKQMDELIVMYYAIELLRVVESLHLAGVVHADIKPDNLLVRNGGDNWCDWAVNRPGSWKLKGLSLIDFGLAIDLGMYDWQTVFVGDCGTEGFRCSEMIEGKPWTWQADMHQIAATVHALLFGKYMQVHKVLTDFDGFKYRPRESLKRWWRTELWEIFFEVLLNFPTLDFKSPPPLGDLRRMFEEHIMEERLGAQLRVGLMKQTVSMFQQLREGKT